MRKNHNTIKLQKAEKDEKEKEPEMGRRKRKTQGETEKSSGRISRGMKKAEKRKRKLRKKRIERRSTDSLQQHTKVWSSKMTSLILVMHQPATLAPSGVSVARSTLAGSPHSPRSARNRLTRGRWYPQKRVA